MNPTFRGWTPAGRDFRWLVLASTCNSVGFGGDFVLVGLLPLLATGSSGWVGVALALYHLPQLVLGVPTGAIADRVDRRRLLRRLELGLAVAFGAFALAFRGGEAGLALTLAIITLLGALRAVYHPVRLSYAFDLVGPAHAVTALGWMTTSIRAGMLVGAVASGFVVQRFGPAYAFLFLGLAQSAAFACLLRLRSAGIAAEIDRAPLGRNIADYLREMSTNRVLLILTVVTALVELFGTSFNTALPEFALVRLETDADGLGLLHGSQAAGGLVAGLVLTRAANLRRRGAAYVCVIAALGASILVLGTTTSFLGALVILAVTSGLISAWDILTQTMMQLCVPNRLRGRAMGAWVFAIGSSPLGHLEMGFLVSTLGLGSALYVNGAGVVAVIAVALLLTPRLRRL